MLLICSLLTLSTARLDTRPASQFAMNAGDAFHLPFGRKSLVEAFVAESADLFGPGGQSLPPALDPPFLGIGIARGEIGADSEHGFDRDRFCDHKTGVAPSLGPNFSGGFEKIPHHCIVALGSPFVRALQIGRA